MIPYKAPEFEAGAFNCPHCSAYSNQDWQRVVYRVGSGSADFNDLRRAQCAHCGSYSLWHLKRMIYPEDAGIQPPNRDLRDEIQEDYLEARSIVNRSPRGAAALLRLCIQKLCQQLGEKGKDLNGDIGSLVGRGLPTRVQQALDVVRVIGNNAVHPGQLDLTDDEETATKLFELVNVVAEVMISQPKQLEDLYQSLPGTAREAIEKRDSTGAVESTPGS